jgi:hypothetical protein
MKKAGFGVILPLVKIGAIPKTRLVSGMALEKAAKCPLFPLNIRLLSQNFSF